MNILFLNSSRQWAGNEKWTCLAAKSLADNHGVFLAGMAAVERIFNTMERYPRRIKNRMHKLCTLSRIISGSTMFVLNIIRMLCGCLIKSTPRLKKGRGSCLSDIAGRARPLWPIWFHGFARLTAAAFKSTGWIHGNIRWNPFASRSASSRRNRFFQQKTRSNIGYGLKDFDEEQVIQADKAAHAWEFISQMEYGLDSEIGERGVMLSG